MKADRRGAGKSAEDLRADSLTAVNLYRDLVRTRASVLEDRRRLRQRMKSALLQGDIHRLEGTLARRPRHRKWVESSH